MQRAQHERTHRAGTTARHLPLGDGIAITGEDLSSLSTLRREVAGPVAPVEWMPPHSSMRQCLLLQSRAAPLSLFSRLFGVDPIAREARRSYSGSLAEPSIADSLAALGSGWTVLHSVPIADDGSEGRSAAVVDSAVSDSVVVDAAVIDHLVIGRVGIFTISTHRHAGQSIWVGEQVGERTFLVDDERLGHLVLADDAGSAVSRRLVAALAAEGTALDAVVIPCIVVDAPETCRSAGAPVASR